MPAIPLPKAISEIAVIAMEGEPPDALIIGTACPIVIRPAKTPKKKMNHSLIIFALKLGFSLCNQTFI